MSDWISVEDRLPREFEGQIIVHYKNHVSKGVTVAGDFFWDIGFAIFHRGEWKPIAGVTHWMPLPEPPIKKPVDHDDE